MKAHLWVPLAAVLIGAVLLLLPKSVDGQSPPIAAPIRADRFGLDVAVHGAARPVYRLGGQSYVEGQMGERYAIRLYNHSGQRVEAVISVDGRDAIDGQPAQVTKRGYVLPPWGSADIDGFRTSLDEVAAFRFTTVSDSYAGRMGTPWRVGVITASFFPERVVRPRPRLALEPPTAAAPAGAGARRAARPEATDQSLGTEFGERRVSPVQETNFARQNPNAPSAVVTLRYNDRRGLCSAGIQSLCDREPWPWPDPDDQPPAPPPRPRFSVPPPPDWQPPLDY